MTAANAALPHRTYFRCMRDSDLQRDVAARLTTDPSVDSARIIVMVDDSIVTLGGWVHSCAEKSAAERIAHGVAGVRFVINALDVRLMIRDARSDAAIARAAGQVLAWNSAVPEGRVHAEVRRAWITLRGNVDWEHERCAAEDALRSLVGVRGITNEIALNDERAAVNDGHGPLRFIAHRSSFIEQ